MTICECCGFNSERKGVAAVGQLLKLTPAERKVFDCMSRNFGGAVETDRLIDALYRDDPDGGPVTATNVLSVIVMNLRKKLEPHGLLIESTRGSGAYRRLKWNENASRA